MIQLVRLNEALFNSAPSEGTRCHLEGLLPTGDDCTDSHPRLCDNGRADQQEVSTAVMIHATRDYSMIHVCIPSH